MKTALVVTTISAPNRVHGACCDGNPDLDAVFRPTRPLQADFRKENGWDILVHSATVLPERNPHDLRSDFKDEISGYLNNNVICDGLARLRIEPGIDNLSLKMLRACRLPQDLGLVHESELQLRSAWLKDSDPLHCTRQVDGQHA